MAETKGNTAQGRYEQCETQRELFLEIARDSKACSANIDTR